MPSIPIYKANPAQPFLHGCHRRKTEPQLESTGPSEEDSLPAHCLVLTFRALWLQSRVHETPEARLGLPGTTRARPMDSSSREQSLPREPSTSSLLHTPSPRDGCAKGKQGQESGYEKAGEVLNQASGAGGGEDQGKRQVKEDTFLVF